MSDVPRKQSVVLGGIKYPLVYLTKATYHELLQAVGDKAMRINLKTQGHDPSTPYKNIVIEMKAFLLDKLVFTTMEE